MSIDWEELLDACGEDLQDAYEALCDSDDDFCDCFDNDDVAPDISWEFIDPDDFCHEEEDPFDENEEDSDESGEENDAPPVRFSNASDADERLERLRDSPPNPSWTERLDRVRQGLPVHNEHAVRTMRAMGSMPLKRYIACLNPFSYEFSILYPLQQELPEDATYQQAADELYSLLMAAGASKTGAEAMTEIRHCASVFHAFVLPFTQVLKDLSSTSD